VRIAEIYSSLQGEGVLTGVPSILVRTSGCNLRCWFCDTPFTSWQPEGDDRSVAEIVAEVIDKREAGGPWVSTWQTLYPRDIEPPLDHVIVTGGEPMLHAELIPLCEQLRDLGLHITIETAGTLYLPVECDLMSISPKLSNSKPSEDHAGNWARRHERDRHQPSVIRRLVDEYNYQIKFVVDAPSDCTEIEGWLQEFAPIPPARVWLMPQGTDPTGLAAKSEWLLPYCARRGFHYCPRRHVEWFGSQRGT
jgi:7-carboxy-7-deazaguanine synthase